MNMRYIVIQVPAYTAIRDTYNQETILTVVTKRDPVNGQDNSFLPKAEFDARVAFILAALNRTEENING